MLDEGTEQSPLKAMAGLPKLSKRDFREVAPSGEIESDVEKVISSNLKTIYEPRTDRNS